MRWETRSRRLTKAVSANVFTEPEIATVGWSQAAIDAKDIDARAVKLPLATTPGRRCMESATASSSCSGQGPGSWSVGSWWLARVRLIHPISLAIEGSLTVDEMAHAFTVYPSLSGSVAEAARRLHRRT